MCDRIPFKNANTKINRCFETPVFVYIVYVIFIYCVYVESVYTINETMWHRDGRHSALDRAQALLSAQRNDADALVEVMMDLKLSCYSIWACRVYCFCDFVMTECGYVFFPLRVVEEESKRAIFPRIHIFYPWT